jgi:predicted kinase
VTSGSPPRLVIIGGAPGTGKTTLARIVAHGVGLPLIARDDLKERHDDSFRSRPAGGLEIDSSALGGASYAMLFAVAEKLVEAGVGVVIESNFRRGIAEPELRPIVAAASAVLLHCELPDEAIVARFIGRAGTAGRHRVHPDLERLPSLVKDLEDGRFEPLDLPVPILRVDTTDGYRPTIEAIIRFVRHPGS